METKHRIASVRIPAGVWLEVTYARAPSARARGMYPHLKAPSRVRQCPAGLQVIVEAHPRFRRQLIVGVLT